MPASSFVPDPDLETVPAVRAPTPPTRTRKAPAALRARLARVLSGEARRRRPPKATLRATPLTILLDRVEAAVQAGVIDVLDDGKPAAEIAVTSAELALLFQILFPEEWPSLAPVSAPARAAPGSAGRIEEYAQRVARGEKLYHPADPCPVRGDGCDGRLVAAGKLALLVAQRANGSGVKVLGWA